MVFNVTPQGHDLTIRLNWDSLGQLYAGIAIAWTCILCAASTWLYLNRKVSSLKMRNIPLAITSVIFLQVYLIIILLAYTINGNFSCGFMFWIMSTWLPLGIGLFQANIAQLDSVSHMQQRMLDIEQTPSRFGKRVYPSGVKGLLARWNTLTALRKTYVFIGLGMLVQLIVTSAVYGTSRTLQGHFDPSLTHAQGAGKCRRRLEWIPSAIWQLWWSCLYGPYLLYRIRHISDVYCWRPQIACSVVAGFPGSPLWLAAIHSPAFAKVNLFWIPPLWIAPGIIVTQFATLFFPIYVAWRARRELLATLAALEAWDEKRSHDSISGSSNDNSSYTLTTTDDAWHKSHFHNTSSFKSVSTTTVAPRSLRNRELHTMAALSKALELNPAPLLHFAATADFSAENIVFLIQVRDFKLVWAQAHSAPRSTTAPSSLPALFAAALSIYRSSIDPATSEFPINISSPIAAQLRAVFGEYVPYRDDSIVDFFKDKDARAHDQSAFSAQSRMRAMGGKKGPPSFAASAATFDMDITDSVGDEERGILGFEPAPCVRPTWSQDTGGIEGFGVTVFNEAEASIRYLVLTNTWQKFVKEAGVIGV
ncbi:hypothetical protein BU16DRAFT_564387 [Lophium mytilinum]|uniref:RGS domain-containing protein n=1 Tax=Lophium mytilinum TaxID=390894 RepID=A0A6A6QL74_9PEZI|nr:hypothetical protein BU16DRAFT_564387 [Lophium mytilinum]